MRPVQKKGLIIVFSLMVLFSILIALLRANKASDDFVKLRMAYHRSSLVGITYSSIAKEYGIDKKYGINLELMPFNTPSDVVRAVIQGQADAAAGAGMVVILGAAENIPLKFFAVYYDSIENPEYFVVRRQGENIQKLADINNRPHTVIAYNPPSPFTESVVKKILGKLGADMSRITMVSAGPGDIVRLFKTGKADLLFAINPAATIAVQIGGGEIIETAPAARYLGSPHIDSAAFVSKEFSVKNPKLFDALSNMYAEAVEIVRQNPEKARSVLGKKAPPEWNSIVQHIIFAGAWGEKEIDRKILQKSFDTLWEEKTIRKKFLAEEFLN